MKLSAWERVDAALAQDLAAAENAGDEDLARKLRREQLDHALVGFRPDRRGPGRPSRDTEGRYVAATAAAEGNYGKGTA